MGGWGDGEMGRNFNSTLNTPHLTLHTSKASELLSSTNTLAELARVLWLFDSDRPL
jgi:hypothetical protein